MKKILILGTLALCLNLTLTQAQPGPRSRGMGGGPPVGPNFGGTFAKLVGENPGFSANMEFCVTNGGSDDMMMPGKIAYLDGKSRFEMNMAEMQGARMQAGASEHLKQMGMDKMVAINLPEKRVSYHVYPGMEAYVEEPLRNPESTKAESDYTYETTKLGKETFDGHPCLKNKVVATDKEGATHESIVWNATDLKDFPIRIESVETHSTNTMVFRNVKFSKPDAAEFEPPASYKKYDTMMAMMQDIIMKRMGGGMGMPH